MKKLKLIVGLLVLAIMVSACAKTKSSADGTEEKGKLIVYYSLTGNTKFAADYIQSLTGADIFKLEPVEPYSEEIFDSIERVRIERELDYRPQLAGGIDNLADYDIIFIGSPNWFGTLSLPVFSFLETHDLSGKTVVPFITYGGGGFENTITDLKNLLPEASVLPEFGIAGVDIENCQPDIQQWLKNIKMLEEE